jgi:hypothetical protein
MRAAVSRYFVPFVMQHRYFSVSHEVGSRVLLRILSHSASLASIFGATQFLPSTQSSLNECTQFRLKAQNQQKAFAF